MRVLDIVRRYNNLSHKSDIAYLLFIKDKMSMEEYGEILMEFNAFKNKEFTSSEE